MNTRTACLLLCLLLCAVVAGAEVPPADEAAAAILARARAASAAAHDKKMLLTMRTTVPDGSTLVRVLRGFEKHGAATVGATAGTSRLWEFEAPADLAGTRFLALPGEGGAPEKLFVYFPQQRRVRQIPPSLRREQFQGALFTLEDSSVLAFDFSGTSRLEREEPCGRTTCSVVDVTLAPESFSYGRLRLWIRADDLLADRIEFFDQADVVLKTLQLKASQQLAGVATPTAMVMEASDAHRTEIELSGIEINQPLDASLFTREHLARGQ